MTTIDEYISGLDAPLDVIAETLRAHLDTGLPGARRELWQGHPTWLKDETPIAGFRAHEERITLVFWRGQEFEDPSGQLVQSGPEHVATMSIAMSDDFEGDVLDDWLRQAAELEGLHQEQ